MTKKLGIGWYDFSKTLTSAIQDENYKGKFKDMYNEFCKEGYSDSDFSAISKLIGDEVWDYPIEKIKKEDN